MSSLSGLGAGTTKHLQALGGHVAVIDLSLPTESSESPKLRSFKADVSNPEEIALAIQGIIAWADEMALEIHAVVCCAGFLGPARVNRMQHTNKKMSKANKLPTDLVQVKCATHTGEIQKSGRHQPHRDHRCDPTAPPAHVIADA
jgi:NAD(P)-dependent dehydrogenase (short-subunit alcohol dehydrogenase family)